MSTLRRSGSNFTREQVIEIYELKNRKWGRQTALSLSQRYGVTTKAVRDIWRGRTWSDVTSESSYTLKRDAVHNGSNEYAKSVLKRRKKCDKSDIVQKDLEEVHAFYCSARS